MAKEQQNREGVRLNKFISHNSKYSRREADKLILDSRVKVDKKLITNPATLVDSENIVSVDDRVIKRMDNLFTVVVYNKPRGELVTKKDDRGRATIYHSLPTKLRHFIPIGRLDYASEGLLLLTDNPKIATILMQSNFERVYNLKIDGFLTKEIEEAMESGVEIENSTKGAHSHTKIDTISIAPFIGYKLLKSHPNYTRLRVAISEGKNRELRRFFAHFDREVLDLRRIAFGSIGLNNLPTKKWRYLTKKEYDDLKVLIREES